MLAARAANILHARVRARANVVTISVVVGHVHVAESLGEQL